MGAGNQHLRATGGAAHLNEIHLHQLTFTEGLAVHLLVEGEDSLGRLAAGADLQTNVAGAGIDAHDSTGEDLMLLGVKLVIDHAVLGLAQTLNDDLLAVAGGDTTELHVLHGQIHDAAQLMLGAEALGLLQRYLGAGVLHHLHDLLLYVHLQLLLLLVHIHDDVLHALMVALVSSGQGLNDLAHHKGLGNAALFFQHCQCHKDLFTLHCQFSLFYSVPYRF